MTRATGATSKWMRNLQEGRHALARKVFHGSKGELYQRYREGMELDGRLRELRDPTERQDENEDEDKDKDKEYQEH